MNIGGLVGFIAVGLACGAAAVRSRDSFYAGMAIAVVAFAGIQVARFGLDTTSFVADADGLVLLVGALLLAAAVTLRHGLPTLEAHRSKREPIVRRVSWLVAAASTVCLVAGALGVPTGIQSLPPEGRAAIVPEHVRPRPAVHLAPLGDVPVAELESLAAFYAERYDLPVGVLPPAPIAVVPRDGTRNQLASEDLIELLQASYPHGQFPNQILIGVVSADMYSRGMPEWRFVFGTWTEGNRAVISTARMTARWGPFGDLLEQARLRKMVTRYIGFMYFGLPESADRHSVLHVPLLSRDDLDAMGDDY